MISAVRAGVEADHLRRRCRLGILEQQQLDPRGLPREHAEIDAVRQDGSAQRKALTGVSVRPRRGRREQTFRAPHSPQARNSPTSPGTPPG